MIILDTNVVSEPLRQQPNTLVVEWIDEQSIETLFLTSITVGEIRYGLAALPKGKRKQSMQKRFETEVLPLFISRVLPYDLAASVAFGRSMAQVRTRGFALATADGNIAAIALTHAMKVATRDTKPFDAAGVSVINPFAPGSSPG
jgi:toxin FitB